uniref:Uncharacterized protein n=1 Tax=Rhizophora mucronata TaxID=61149 RepID=A0A2P2QNP4_RHIMU
MCVCVCKIKCRRLREWKWKGGISIFCSIAQTKNKHMQLLSEKRSCMTRQRALPIYHPIQSI